MPIEFRCESCSKLLRTPDESAGKKAKCPQCGTIVDVPVGGAPSEPVPPADPAPTAGSQLFSSTPDANNEANPFSPMDQAGVTNDDNPYASPGVTPAVHQAKQAIDGELSHGKISFDDILRTAWSITLDNLGPMALFGVVLFGVQIAMAVVNQGINFAGGLVNEPLVAVAVQMVSMVINVAVQTWVGIVSILFCTRLARDRRSDLNILTEYGPYFMRSLGLSLVLGGITVLLVLVLCGTPALVAWITTRDQVPTIIATIVGAIVCIIPVLLVFMNYLLGLFFIVDRQEGVFAAMGLSRQFMRGNKMTAFLTIFVMQILGGLFVLFTCCAGRIIYDPFSILVLSLIYLNATGQAFQRPIMK